jgi:DNA gyrase subunit A
MAIRFKEEEVRPMGLVAAGVMGLKLQDRDEVVGAEVLPKAGEAFMVASDGSAKRVALEQFPVQGRYGQGVVAWKLPAKAQAIGLVVGKGSERVTLHLAKTAPKMVRLDEAPLQGRATRGKNILDIKPGDRVVRLTVAWEAERPLAGQASKGRPGKKKTSSQGEASAGVAAEKSGKDRRKTSTRGRMARKMTKD